MLTLPIKLKTTAWDNDHRSPATPQYIDIVGDEIREIDEAEAVRLIEAGEAVAMTYLNWYPKAPGLGIAAGRPNVPSPIKTGLMVVFGQEVGYAGDKPAWARVEKLPSIAHTCYHIVNARWRSN